MNKLINGFLYKPSNIVVVNKEDIANTKDDDFLPIRIFLREKDIKDWNEEIEIFSDDENDDDLI